MTAARRISLRGGRRSNFAAGLARAGSAQQTAREKCSHTYGHGDGLGLDGTTQENRWFASKADGRQRWSWA